MPALRSPLRGPEITGLIRGIYRVFDLSYGLVARRRVHGLDGIPAQGGCVVAVNHVTEIDPITVAMTVAEAGRTPRFLAKESLFRVPVLGSVLRRAEQVPVHRNSRDSVRALASAQERVAGGGCVVVYPEGTLTRDPQRWPMHAYTGAARLALSLDVPLIPMAHWGDQEILGRDEDWRLRVSLRPRRPVEVRVGQPVDLSRWRPDPEAVRGLSAQQRLAALPQQSAVEATTALMDAIAAELSVLRGEPVPPLRWDRRIKDRR